MTGWTDTLSYCVHVLREYNNRFSKYFPIPVLVQIYSALLKCYQSETGLHGEKKKLYF